MYIQNFSGQKERVKGACLLLHGFPAATFSDPAHEKNQDIGKSISELGFDVVLPHYRGLGKSKGVFSFLQSIDDACQLAVTLSEKYVKVHLVGHSWGGLVAMNIVNRLGTKHGGVVLLSPFTEIPDASIMKEVLTTVGADAKICYAKGSVDAAVDELMIVKNSYSPKRVAESCFGEHFLIVQSKHDDEVPVESTRKFANSFKSKPKYVEFDSDHKFSINRTELKDLITNFLYQESQC